MATLDEILNIGIPFLLIAIVLGWLYVKLFSPYVIPMLKNLYEWMNGRSENNTSNAPVKKEIIYE